jgi:hypothetical protein
MQISEVVYQFVTVSSIFTQVYVRDKYDDDVIVRNIQLSCSCELLKVPLC